MLFKRPIMLVVANANGVAVLSVAALMAACLIAAQRAAAAPTDQHDEAVRFFETSVRPVLAEHCYQCHGEDAQEAGLRLDRPEQLFDEARTPPIIAVGDVEKSWLIQLIRGTAEVQMPPDNRLKADEVKAIEQWVAAGAVWPQYTSEAKRGAVYAVAARAEFTQEERDFWAFRHGGDPAVPTTKDRDWPANDVDRFVLARLESAGLRPAPRTGKRDLLRRATYDLTGLPPTPEEMADFLADESAEAFAKVVNRLLASPRYGEQWGRHWLDVVRFAESGGYDGNEAYLQAWRYRDYVIKSFNNDKPYDQFVKEQLAGDLLEKTDNPQRDFDQVVATGFLQVGPKPGVMRDKQQMLLDITDELINATGVTFLGLTLGCARCHDHKFDPIPTSDYYSLAGIFMSTQVMADLEPNSKWLEYETPGPNEGKTKVMAVRDGPQPSNLRIHLRGSYRTLGREAPRRFLQITCGDETPSLAGSGRLELAEWIASADNPLTARVMVNRIWQHHFGRGLVATSGNFGRMGAPPSHPELLDWLAARFVESGWSVKAMHRLIVMSSAYQQAGVVDERADAIDPEGELLSRRPPRRLAAEELRDSLLAVSGRLDTTMSGTLFTEGYSPVDAARELYTVAIAGRGGYGPFDRPRRSVYLPVIRNARPDILKAFDVANEHEPTAVRTETTVPSQALFMLNSLFVRQTTAALAERLLRDSGAFSLDFEQRTERMINRLYDLVLCRQPTAAERERLQKFIVDYAAQASSTPADEATRAAWDVRLKGQDGAKPLADLPQFLAWQAACRTLLAANEFMYVP